MKSTIPTEGYVVCNLRVSKACQVERALGRLARNIICANMHLVGIRHQSDRAQSGLHILLIRAANHAGEVGLRFLLQRHLPGNDVFVGAHQLALFNLVASSDGAVGGYNARQTWKIIAESAGAAMRIRQNALFPQAAVPPHRLPRRSDPSWQAAKRVGLDEKQVQDSLVSFLRLSSASILLLSVS